MLAKLARWLAQDAAAATGVPVAGFHSSGGQRLPPVPEAARRAAQQATLERLRSPMRESDRTLSLEARLWLLRLPPALQPHILCREHPRVVNRLAAEWLDTLGIETLFDDLLHDRRGGRKGFGAPMQRELRRLRHFSVRYRALIETRRRMVEPSDDTLPIPLDSGLADGIDWTPTETIVVQAKP